MRLFASAGALAIVAAAWGTAAAALTLAEAASPAETPPSGYARDVYVDSRGCVYVRANIGTTVNWVPRLSRDRTTVVCGSTPTGAVASVTAPPPAAPVPPAPPPRTVMPVAAPAAPVVVLAAPTVPAHTAAPVAPTHKQQVPAGYRAAWDDGRLNPHRGPRTAHGDAQMATIFDTTKVPMRAFGQ
jgi:hypothetical protein